MYISSPTFNGFDSVPGSGNLRVLWKVSCVGRCFAEADRWRSVSLKWTQVKGCFATETCERTRDEGFFVITHVLVCLTCIIVRHLSGLQGEKHQKTCGVLMASCEFHDLGRLAVMSADTDSHTEARHVGTPHPRTHDIWREYI